MDDEITVASLVGQEGFGPSSAPRVRYAALEQAFSAIAQNAQAHKASVHMPRIGAGQSGGLWNTVEEIVRDTLISKGVRVTVYDLPPKREPGEAGVLI